MKAKTNATTTVRVRKETRERLKMLSANEKVSITDLIERLVDEHETSFWKDIDSEAGAYMDKKEFKTRKVFDGALENGVK